MWKQLNLSTGGNKDTWTVTVLLHILTTHIIPLDAVIPPTSPFLKASITITLITRVSVIVTGGRFTLVSLSGALHFLHGLNVLRAT